jgi:hypothetical protein
MSKQSRFLNVSIENCSHMSKENFYKVCSLYLCKTGKNLSIFRLNKTASLWNVNRLILFFFVFKVYFNKIKIFVFHQVRILEHFYGQQSNHQRMQIFFIFFAKVFLKFAEQKCIAQSFQRHSEAKSRDVEKT